MFKNRKWIGVSIITLLTAAVLALGGWSLYRLGFNRGAYHAQAILMTEIVEMRSNHPGMGTVPDRDTGKLPPHAQGFGPGKGQNRSSPGQPDDGAPGIRGAFSARRAPTRGLALWSMRLLFAAGMFGLLTYVVVKLFQPGGWQLSFGPLYAPSEDENAKGSTTKARPSQKK